MATEFISCETCAYSVTITGWRMGQASDMTWMECHRRPPTVVTNHHSQPVSVWPEIKPGDRCGEWSATFK